MRDDLTTSFVKRCSTRTEGGGDGTVEVSPGARDVNKSRETCNCTAVVFVNFLAGGYRCLPMRGSTTDKEFWVRSAGVPFRLEKHVRLHLVGGRVLLSLSWRSDSRPWRRFDANDGVWFSYLRELKAKWVSRV